MIWHRILRAQSKDALSPEDWETLQKFAWKVLQVNFLDVSEKELVQELFSDMYDHQKQVGTAREAIDYIADALAQAHQAIADGKAKSLDDFYANIIGTHLKQGVFRKGKALGLSKRVEKQIRKTAKQKDGAQVPVDDMGTIVTISMRDQVEAQLKEELLHKKLKKTIGQPRKKT